MKTDFEILENARHEFFSRTYYTAKRFLDEKPKIKEVCKKLKITQKSLCEKWDKRRAWYLFEKEQHEIDNYILYYLRNNFNHLKSELDHLNNCYCDESMGGVVEFYACGRRIASFDRGERYARSCKWRGRENHGCVEIPLPSQFLRDDVKSIGGLLTLEKQQPQKNTKKPWWLSIRECEWVEFYSEGKYKNKKYFYKIKKGFLVGTDYHADDLKIARWKLNEIKEDIKRRKQAERRFKREEKEILKDFNKGFKIFQKLEVTIQDSLDSGNCRAGTAQFIRDFDIKEKSMSGKKLLSYVNKNNAIYIYKIFVHLLKKHGIDFDNITFSLNSVIIEAFKKKVTA